VFFGTYYYVPYYIELLIPVLYDKYKNVSHFCLENPAIAAPRGKGVARNFSWGGGLGPKVAQKKRGEGRGFAT
jgi:hypothetical protein